MRLGFSVYLGLDNTMEENIKLLEKAYNLGFKRIFTSLHIPEANYDILKKDLFYFFKKAKEFDMDIISDISPNTFKFLGLADSDLEGLKNLGVKTIRIDFGYTPEEIAHLSKNTYGIKIQLNASTATEEFFKELDTFNPNFSNIDALHNFYPRVGTGISEEGMIKKNNLFKKRGIKVYSFVQSNYRKRSPLKDGLPTLEDHRGLDVKRAANHLFAIGNDGVFIGDSLPSDKELEDLGGLREDAIELSIEKKVKNPVIDRFLAETYSSRTDEARDAIRAAESRLILNGDKIEVLNTTEKKYGDITLDNYTYGRYMGELQIVKVDIKEDSRTNVIGNVIDRDLYLLKYIKDGKKFYFNCSE